MAAAAEIVSVKLVYRTEAELLLLYFAFDHLPEHLQVLSRPFAELAQHVMEVSPNLPEKVAGLRKLLEAKDCIVRAGLAPT